MTKELNVSLDHVTITPEEARQLTDLGAKRDSLQGFIQQMMTAGERRNQELLNEGRLIWEAIGKKYNLDLERVAYDVKGGELVPTQVRL